MLKVISKMCVAWSDVICYITANATPTHQKRSAYALLNFVVLLFISRGS